MAGDTVQLDNGERAVFANVVTASQVISKHLMGKEAMLTKQQLGVYLIAAFLELRQVCFTGLM